MILPPPWARLIRFISSDDVVHYGDVIAPSSDFDVGSPSNASSLTARLITGNPFGPDCKVTDTVLPVKKLLGPFTKDTIPAVRCIGGNYGGHLNELGMKPPRFPVMFPKLPNAVCGYGDDVEIPKIAQDNQADYEGELVIVMGKDAKNVKAKDALEYVAGYTVGNDVSSRKWQWDPDLVGTSPPPQMSFSKSFDTFAPMGPCITSTTLIPNPHVLPLCTRVNGEIRQQSNTSDLLFNVAQIIEFCSQGTTLQARSVIFTGTPSGVGYTMSPPQWLKPGDQIEITIGPMTLIHGVKYA
ncbi:hypothetical protein F5884DRAFT_686359 [Xylogone sp. PMI_703]|nr:hypothetical protein F5884DRAFT_686359 [Xylogone sp. PMI_703]